MGIQMIHVVNVRPNVVSLEVGLEVDLEVDLEEDLAIVLS
jgi:hypothetical protein